MQLMTISGQLTSLNDYIKAERGNRYAAAKLKRVETSLVMWECKLQQLSYIDKPCWFIFRWYCKNKKKDPDNIAYAKKQILDGLVNAGILDSDGWDYVRGFKDEFYIDRREPRIEVVISNEKI